MKLIELKNIISGSSYAGRSRAESVLPRYAAMVGIEITAPQVEYAAQEENAAIEIPMESVREILALDFAERATGDLRAMGEAIGKIHVSVPSNINVWQHLKGEAPLQEAANSLAAAAKLIASR